MSTLAGPPERVQTPFRIGEIDVLPASNEIARGEGRVRLRPLLMQVLCRLAAARGEVVSRQAFLDEVWPRRMVNDDVLSRTMAELREVLGDDAREPRYIETLPKVGYRLIAAVTPARAAEPPAAEPTAPPTPAASAILAPRTRPWRMPPGATATAAVVALAAIALGVGYLTTSAKPRALLDVRELERRLLEAQPLGSSPAIELAPRFSPDGRQVVYVERDTSSPMRSRLVLRDLGSGERRVLVDLAGALQSPAWLPDGQAIAYYRATTQTDCAIVLRDIARAVERTLIDCASRPNARFDVARDGRTLVMSAAAVAQDPARLVAIDLASGSRRELTAPPPGAGEDVFPRVSPDGRIVGFFRGTESHRELWTVELDAPPTARRAAPPRGLVYGLAWLDPDHVVTAADWLGFRALNLVHLPSGAVHLVGARGARFPDVDPHGAIVFEQAQYHADLWRLPPGDAAPVVTWPSTRYTSQPEYAPDGSRVAVVSNRDGAEALYVGEIGRTMRRVALVQGVRLIRPHWSADGGSLYAVAIERTPTGETQRGIRVDLEQGTIASLPGLGDAVFDVQESADGRFLWVGEQVEHAVRLVRVQRDGRSGRERLPLPLMSEYRIRGDRLLFTQPQLVGLTSCALVTLACAPVPVAIGDSNRFEWAVTARSVYYVARDDGTARLQRFDLATGAVETRFREVPGSDIVGVAARSADDEIMVARGEPPAIDVMLTAPGR